MMTSLLITKNKIFIDMKVQELDNILNEILVDEAKKVIMEQMENPKNIMGMIKGFKSLSGLLNKIDNTSDGSSINIKNVTPEELIQCCGGDSLGNAQTKLMQGIHHDLEDNGIGKDFDVDIDTQGDANALQLTIRITPNTDKTLSDTNEGEDNDDKKIILGGGHAQPGDFMGGDKPQEVREDKKRIENNKSMKKKTITLDEAQMAELIKKAIIEGVPGIDITKRVTKEAGKQNAEALKQVESKIKQYVTYKGSKKPNFPEQNGIGAEKKARVNTAEQDKLVDLNRGQGIGDADFDYEPGKEYTDRQKDAIEGSSKMGNPSDAANAIPTDVNKKVSKGIEARKKAKKTEPFYAKESVPVDTKKQEEVRSVNESVEKDIARMKRMSSYNAKTQ